MSPNGAGPALHPLRQRHLSLLVGLQVLLAIVVLTGTLLGVRDLREEALAGHLRQASLQVRSIEDHVSQNLHLIGLMLASLPELLVDPRPIAAQEHGKRLESIQRQMPAVRSLSIADAQGRILASSTPANVGKRVDFSGFLPAMDEPREGVMRFGPPYAGRDFHDSREATPDRPADARASTFLPAMQALPGPEGLIAVVAINPDCFLNHIAGQIDTALGHVTLFDYRGVTVLSTWEGQRVGSPIEDPQVLELARTLEIGELPDDMAHGRPTLTVFRALREHPFFVLAHIDRAAALAQWREATAVRLALVALALLATLFVTGLLTFRLRAQFVREARLQEAQRENEHTIRQLSMAIEQSPSGIVITTPDPAIVYVNPHFTKITGYQPEEVFGRNPRLLQSKLTPTETYAAMWARLTAGEAWEGEFINRRKDGSLYHEHTTVAPVKDERGNTINYVAIKYDITERKQLEQELIQAKEAAEAASVAKSRFLATMSHEIRTPLNGVLGMAQLLLSGRASPQEAADYARTILHSGQSLLQLLNDVLDYSKVEAGKLELERRPLDPTQLLHEVQALFAETAHGKGLQLSAEWQGGDDAYLADIYRLQQMLSNLVANAIKFTAAGEVRIVASEVVRDGKFATLEFAVSDTGIGIPAEKQALLFKPFSQADNSTTREFGGTGLGLSIVKNLARLMGGDVGLSSEPGQGSRFWFRIRAEVSDASERRRLERAPLPEATEPPTAIAPSPLRGDLLVVEDDAINQKIIRAMLSNLGLSAVMAENGQQAVERIAGGEHFDLILMDVQMPVMDGLTATAQIRRRERERGEAHRIIVAMTADAFAETREHCIQTGMDDFLTKPIDVAELTRLLRHWLG